MNSLRNLWLGLMWILMAGCLPEEEAPDLELQSYEYNFAEGNHGWTGDFSDYPVSDTGKYQLNFDYTYLPSNLDSQKGLMFSGYNAGGDLFMFIKKKITSLKPNTEYTIAFEIELASNVSLLPAEWPNASVLLKAGATEVEPVKLVNGDYYVLNIDKGDGMQAGQDMIVVEDVTEEINAGGYSVATFTSSTALFSAKSDHNGELWSIIGTESAFQGLTSIYFTKVKLVFSVSN